MKTDQEERLWLLLAGAMLTSKGVRDEAALKLKPEDAPELIRPLLSAMNTGNGVEVGNALECLGMSQHAGGAVKGLIGSLQQATLARWCNRAMSNVQNAKGVDPDLLLDMLDSLATNIRARKAAMDG